MGCSHANARQPVGPVPKKTSKKSAPLFLLRRAETWTVGTAEELPGPHVDCPGTSPRRERCSPPSTSGGFFSHVCVCRSRFHDEARSESAVWLNRSAASRSHKPARPARPVPRSPPVPPRLPLIRSCCCCCSTCLPGRRSSTCSTCSTCAPDEVMSGWLGTRAAKAAKWCLPPLSRRRIRIPSQSEAD